MLSPIPHTDGMGENGGWAICDADPIRFIGVCRRAPSRPSKSPWRTRGLFGLAACLVSFQPDSNRRPPASEADALSTELWNVGGFSTRTYYASVGMAGLEPAASRPPAARAANCATFRNRRHPPPEPKHRWAKKEDGGVARRPGLEPGSTVLETAVLAIAPPTQRGASMTPRAWPPGPPDGRRRGRLPRAPSRIRTGDLPLTRRLRYHWAIGALTVPPIAFSNA